MFFLFVLFLLIDIIIAYIMYREAFIVRSNMRQKYRTRFILIATVIAAALAAQFLGGPYALIIAGLPACVAVFFVVAMGIAMMTHKGPWR
jgi:hypothetical protein